MLPTQSSTFRTFSRISAGPFAISRSYASSTPRVVLSGIQPTGVPHIGNYLGALRRWVQLQDERDSTLLYSLVDLHAMTGQQSASQLRTWRRESLAALLAIGLDPKRSVIFYQSSVPEHSELMWILSCSASMGYLSRMTQWKSKLQLAENANPLDATTKTNLRLGLFSYPVLQAADILLYGTTHVPVGDDQAQHLEFTREVAVSFNHRYGSVLTLPETVLSPAKRIMSLTDPTNKMSKSSPDPRSRILLTDPFSTISKKLRTALTDSEPGPIAYNPASRPGVANLLAMLYHLEAPLDNGTDGARTVHDVARDCAALSLRALKERVADVVERTVGPIRERFEAMMGERDGRTVDEVAERGAEQARDRAKVVMGRVKEAVGLL